MTVMKNLSLLNRSISSAWTSLAGKRSRIASYGRPPMAVGVVILTVLAWTLGHYTAPVHTQARTVARRSMSPRNWRKRAISSRRPAA